MAKRIEFLKERGLTSVMLAERLQLTQPQVSMWLSGRLWPTKRNFFKLVNALEVTPEELGHYLIDRWIHSNRKK